MTRVERIANKIGPYIPTGIAPSIAMRIVEYKVIVRITRPRLSKTGDYRPPYKGDTHRISVNGDLNSYSFLVTLLHEFAHLEAWSIQNDLKEPHGKIWKAEFRKLLLEYLDVFPIDIKKGLISYLQNPKASSCTDEKLTRLLSKYDEKRQVYLEDIPFNKAFILPGESVW